MPEATLRDADFLEHGRRIGLFPEILEDRRIGHMSGLEPSPDAVALLKAHAEGEWHHTPIAADANQVAHRLFYKATPTTTEVPALRVLSNAMTPFLPTGPRKTGSPTTFFVGSILAPSGSGEARSDRSPDAFVALARIRNTADLTVAELAAILGRSRKQYYNWRSKGVVPRAIEDKAKLIADALVPARAQPAQRVKGWLFSDAAQALLAKADLADFVEEAGSWALSIAAPKPTRRLGPSEVTQLAVGEAPELDEDELAAFFTRAQAQAPNTVRPNSRFYRDLSGSPANDHE